MHLIGGAAAVIAPFIVAGCFATASATVGTISECGPGLDAANCRSLAQIGLNAYAGPVLSADNIAVNVWASCSLDGVETMSADAAKDGVTCYSVYAQAANSGGRRVAEGVYDGGSLVSIESLVWADADSRLHVVTKAVP